jgi:hypothetical protein
MDYKFLRDIIEATDNNLTSTQFDDNVNLITNLGVTKRGIINIRFLGKPGTLGSPEEYNFFVYGARSKNSQIEYVTHGVATLGTHFSSEVHPDIQTYTDPGEEPEIYYASELSLTNSSNWLRPIVVKNGYHIDISQPDTPVDNSGIAQIQFDSMEYKYFMCLFDLGTCAAAAAQFTLTSY